MFSTYDPSCSRSPFFFFVLVMDSNRSQSATQSEASEEFLGCIISAPGHRTSPRLRVGRGPIQT